MTDGRILGLGGSGGGAPKRQKTCAAHPHNWAKASALTTAGRPECLPPISAAYVPRRQAPTKKKTRAQYLHDPFVSGHAQRRDRLSPSGSLFSFWSTSFVEAVPVQEVFPKADHFRRLDGARTSALAPAPLPADKYWRHNDDRGKATGRESPRKVMDQTRKEFQGQQTERGRKKSDMFLGAGSAGIGGLANLALFRRLVAASMSPPGKRSPGSTCFDHQRSGGKASSRPRTPRRFPRSDAHQHAGPDAGFRRWPRASI